MPHHAKHAESAGVLRAAALAHPNIALIKYWGKRDAALNLPVVGSLSITLDRLWTRTSVQFVPGQDGDRVQLNGRQDAATTARLSKFLDLMRQRAGVDWGAQVESHNNFPTAAGLASSASGFAALALAAGAALDLALSESELSELARRGSGSAARSIFGGFVEWRHGERADGADSIAHRLHGVEHWPLRVVVAVTSTASKAVGSSEGMQRTALTSPYQSAWIGSQEADLACARAAIEMRDFDALADVSEHSCLKMHALAMAAQPGLLYWNGATIEAMHTVRSLRAQGVPVFFTVDAGPQVKAICLPQAASTVIEAMRSVAGVLDVIECGLGQDACLIEDHSGAASA
ncbi:MAG TPA: diphosphomevalonate decarboxylase [Chiayiivirga sp.]|nr:diphosphomevalonate decarboxylase [Chiayiivirga sp.]